MDAPPAGTVTPRLGEWVAGLELAAVPNDVISHLKLCALDSIGCGLYGAAQPWGRITADTAIALSGGGPSSLLGRAEKVSPADATLANGTAIHGFEIDDAHVSSSLHPGAVTLPAALALGEARGISGAELLTALVAGYEVGLRVGICAGLWHSTSGYHVTGTAGTLASSAAAARVMRLSPEKTAHALAIGATQAAGLYSARRGAMTKRFHAGRASQSGVLAALLADRGFTSTLKGQFASETILNRLGETWEAMRVGLKAYAACASAHTTIDGVRELRSRGLTAANLQRMTVRMSNKGHINIAWPYKPGEVITAQMNGFYAAAVVLLDGDAFIDQYAESRLADPDILALIPRISIVHDPDLDLGGASKRHAVGIEAVQSDGTVLTTFAEQRRGSAEHPLSVDEVQQKFRRLVKDVLPARGGDALIEMLGGLESRRDLGELMSLIRGVMI